MDKASRDEAIAEFARDLDYSAKLAPFKKQVEEVVLREMGPPPSAPNPNDFRLTDAVVLRALTENISMLWQKLSVSERFWAILMPTAAELLAALYTSPILSNSNWFTIGFVGCALFLLQKQFVAPWIVRWLRHVEKKQWSHEHPYWNEFVSTRATYEAALKNYKTRKGMLIEAKAEAALKIAKTREAFWRAMTGVEFERTLGGVFKANGYQVEFTPYTGDGGVDTLLRKNGKLTVVQCKAHKTKVSISTARELVAAISDFKADDGVIACFEGVTGPVSEYIKKRSIKVMTIPEIIALQRQHRPL